MLSANSHSLHCNISSDCVDDSLHWPLWCIIEGARNQTIIKVEEVSVLIV